MERLKLFDKSVDITTMRDTNTNVGYDITSYATDVVNEFEFYTSINTLSFSYSNGLPHLSDIKQDNYVRAYTNGTFNLYVITSIEYDTINEVLDVYCDHFTTLYAGEALPNITLFKKNYTLYELVTTLNSNQFKSPDYFIRVAGGTLNSPSIDLSGYTFGNQTMGQILIGASSFLRKYYGVVVIRDLSGLVVINPENNVPKTMPLVLGVNIQGLNYKIEEVQRYSNAMVNLSSIPRIEVAGTGLNNTQRVYTGLGNSNLSQFSEIDEGDMVLMFYKGLLMRFYKRGGQLYVEPYDKPRMLTNVGSYKGIEPIFHQVVPQTFDGSRIKLVLGSAGNEDIVMDEIINPRYLTGYRAYVNYTNVFSDPQGQLGTYKYFGFTPEPYNGVGENNQDIIFNTVTTDVFKVPVNNPYYTGKGTNTYVVDFEEPEEKVIKREGKNGGFYLTDHFYRWFLRAFQGFWHGEEAKRLNKPKFSATVEIDAMTSIFGESYTNFTQFELGDKYNVDADEQGLSFQSEITKITYDVSLNELISVEFGNEQDFEIDEIEKSNANSEQSKRIYDSKTKDNNNSSGDTSTTHSPEETPTSGSDQPTKEELLDEIWETIGGGPLRDEEALFNDDLDYEVRTDDSGIPYFKWSEDVITIPIGAEESSPSKLLAYNGAEAVISEIRLDRDTATGGELVLNADGRFNNSNIRGRLPINDGYAIIPNPEPDKVIGTRSWPPVFTNAYTSNLKKGDSYSMYQTQISEEDFNAIFELYEHKNFRYLDFTKSGTLITNIREREDNNKIFFLSSGMDSRERINTVEALLLEGREDFTEKVIKMAIGKTISNRGSNGNNTLLDYIAPGGVKRAGFKTPYYKFLLGIRRGAGRSNTQSSPESGIWLVQNGLLEVHWKKVDFQPGDYTHEITNIVVHWDQFTSHPLYNELVTRTQGWQGVYFTQPVTKVDGKTVKVPGLLLNNGGPTVFNAMLNKTEIDKLWNSLTPEQKKDFEYIYGSEQGYKNKILGLKYADDDYLLSYHFKKTRGLNLVDYDTIFDSKILDNHLHTQEYNSIEARTQHKYSYLVSQGYTVTADDARIKTWDELIALYDNPE